MKCGKELKTEQTFCQHCLDVMDSYPVKPDVHIQLPNRSAAAQQKRSGKKRPPASAEEQIGILRNRVHALVLLVLTLIMLLCVSMAAVFYLLDKTDVTLITDGQPAVTQSEQCFT